MKPKKILVMDNFVHNQYGGGQVFSDWLFERLKDLDYLQVSKLDQDSIENFRTNKMLSALEAGYYQLAKKLVGFPLLKTMNTFISGGVESIKLRLQSKLMTGQKYDVVISNDFRDLWIIDKAGMSLSKLLVVLHNPELERYLKEGSKADFLQKIFNTSHYLRKYSRFETTVFVALNCKQEKLIKSYLSGNVHTVPLGIDVNKYAPAPCTSVPKISLFVGRLFEKQKRLSILISMFAKFSAQNWLFYIIGDGPDRKLYQELIKSLGVEERIVITGFISEGEKIGFLQKSRALLSASRKEGLPFSYLEALSTGVPVISYRNNGSEALVVDGVNGFLVEDDASMMQKVEELMTNDELMSRMSKNARESVVPKYDQEEVLKQYLSLIEIS